MREAIHALRCIFWCLRGSKYNAHARFPRSKNGGASTCNYPSHYIIVTSSLEQQIVYTGIAGIAGIKGNWVILVWQVGLVLLVSKVSGVLKVTG